jgi:hypothetical protein
MRISSFETKDGAALNLGDFTVLVGANNVGKSQTLRDMHTKLSQGDAAKAVIVSNLSADIPESLDEFMHGVTISDDHINAGYTLYRGIISNLVKGEEVRVPAGTLEEQFKIRKEPHGRQWLLTQFGKYQVAYLDAGTRLQIASFAPSHDPSQQTPQRLLQTLIDNRDGQEKLARSFKDTFSMEIRLDYSMLANLYLRVAKEFPDIPEHPTHARPIMQQFGTLDEQGDGFRSFAGVLLSILLSEGRVLLIDEPEAFLHPAQARRLGYWVAQYAREAGSQIVVATHNAHFLRGVLSSTGDVDVCRLNRNGDSTEFQIMGADAINNLSSSPLLSSQPVLESIFFHGVIVCEADSDRLYYQTVAAMAHDEHEVQFLHAHNKQTLKDVVMLLRAVAIPCAAIADIDLLNSKSDLTALVESFGCSPCPDDITSDRDLIAASIEGRTDDEVLNALSEGLREFLEQLTNREHKLAGARSALRRLDAGSSKWSPVKLRGVDALDEPAKTRAEILFKRLKSIGVFVVPVGELESWADVGTRRKKNWIVLALQQLKDTGAPKPIDEFIKQVISHAKSQPSLGHPDYGVASV